MGAKLVDDEVNIKKRELFLEVKEKNLDLREKRLNIQKEKLKKKALALETDDDSIQMKKSFRKITSNVDFTADSGRKSKSVYFARKPTMLSSQSKSRRHSAEAPIPNNTKVKRKFGFHR